MKEGTESGGCGCGCGCLIIMFSLLLFMFTITWDVKSCESKSLWQGGVETVKEYYSVADSVWNTDK